MALWAKIDKILSDCADHHIPILVGIFGVGTLLSWYRHLDSSYVEFAGLVISGVTGHAIWSHKNGDGDDSEGEGSAGPKG
jgi:hypothetical protein